MPSLKENPGKKDFGLYNPKLGEGVKRVPSWKKREGETRLWEIDFNTHGGGNIGWPQKQVKLEGELDARKPLEMEKLES